jgi:hypothetical protein
MSAPQAGPPRAAPMPPQPDHVAIAAARVRDQQALYLSRRGLGLSIAGAAKASGIDADTAYKWREDPEFLAICSEAHRKGLDLQEDILLSHGRKDWRAAMAVLRVHRPETWDRRKGAQAINVDDADRVDPWEMIDHVEVDEDDITSGPGGDGGLADILAGLSGESGTEAGPGASEEDFDEQD